MLFVISAPSGAGKTTIVKKLLENNPDLKFSVSATTRKKRSNEINGKDYFFLTKHDFEDKIKSNELIEYEKLYNDIYYGSLKSIVDESLNYNEDIVFDIDVKGALNIKKIYGDDAVTVFIKPPDYQTLIQRLRDRNTEDEKELELRISRIEMEMSKAGEFDHVVINDDLDNAVNKVQKIYLQYKNHKE